MPLYGKGQSWHRKTIKKIAIEVGLGDLYRFYGLMSSVAHGDALPAIMEAGVAWRKVGEPIDAHFGELVFDYAYMLMASLYEDAVKCLSLDCCKELALLRSLSIKRARAFEGDARGGSSTVLQ
jgi:hypothetical protein